MSWSPNCNLCFKGWHSLLKPLYHGVKFLPEITVSWGKIPNQEPLHHRVISYWNLCRGVIGSRIKYIIDPDLAELSQSDWRLIFKIMRIQRIFELETTWILTDPEIIHTALLRELFDVSPHSLFTATILNILTIIELIPPFVFHDNSIFAMEFCKNI